MSSLSSLPFLLDFSGVFREDQVCIIWHPEELPTHPRVEQLKADWPRHVREVEQRGGILFNGQMVRCLGYRVERDGHDGHEGRDGHDSHEGHDDQRLMMDAGPTDYATYYCTNYLHHSLGDSIGWEHFANPIGISANVITSDGWILYGRRNQRVATHPGAIHTFGGTVDRSDVKTADNRSDVKTAGNRGDNDTIGERSDINAAGQVDVFGSMARELREELRLTEGELVEQVCLGMIRDPQLRQPELIFDSRIAATRAELESRIPADDEEHARVEATRDDPAAIAEFLQTPDLVPVAIGSLMLHTWSRWQ